MNVARSLTPAGRWLTSAGIGVAILYLLSYVLLVTNIFYTVTIGLALIVALVGATLVWRASKTDARHGAVRLSRAQGIVGTVYIGLIVSAMVVTASVAPVFSWDASSYHLPTALMLLQGHGINGLSSDFFAVMTYPHGAELAFAWVLTFWRSWGASLVIEIAFWIVGAVATYDLSRLLGAARWAAVLSGIAWLLTPIIILQNTASYVDGMFAAAMVSSIALFVRLWRSPTVVGLLGAGAWLAVALSIKQTAILSSLLLIGVTFIVMIRDGQWKKATLSVMVLIGVCALIGGFWYIRDFVLYGNPVAPFGVKAGEYILFNGPLSLNAVDRETSFQLAHPALVNLLMTWLERWPLYSYDSITAGYGLYWFAIGLPAIAAYVFSRRWTTDSIGLLIGSSVVLLVTPAFWIPRYGLAEYAVGLAVAAVAVGRFRGIGRRLLTIAANVALLFSLIPTLSGVLTYDGNASLAAQMESYRPWAYPNPGDFRWMDGSLLTRQLRIGYLGMGSGQYLLAPLWGSQLQNYVIYVGNNIGPPTYSGTSIKYSSMMALIRVQRLSWLVVGDDSPVQEVLQRYPRVWRKVWHGPSYSVFRRV